MFYLLFMIVKSYPSFHIDETVLRAELRGTKMERMDKKQRLDQGTPEPKRTDEERSRDKLVADALAMKEEREALPIFSGVFYKFFLVCFLVSLWLYQQPRTLY